MKARRILLLGFIFLAGATGFFLSPPARQPGDAVISANAVLELHAPWSQLHPDAPEKRWTLNDPVMQIEPWRELMSQEMKAGRLPLWNHLNGFGEPFLANPQTRCFYPPQWLFLLGDEPLDMAWPFYFFHVLLGGFGLFVLARRFEVGLCGSLLSGLSFACLGFNALWLLWPHHSTLAWLPWLLVACDRMRERLTPGSFVTCSLVLGMMLLAGHPETAFKSLVAAFLFTMGRHIEARSIDSARHALSLTVLALVLSALLAALFAAMQLLPFLDYLFGSEALLRRRDAVAFPPHADLAAFARGTAAYFAHLMSPDILGDGMDIDRWWFTEGNHNEVASAYCGVLVLFLALFGLKARPRFPWSLTLMLGFSLAVVLRVPGLYHLILKVPGFDVGANSRFLAIVGMTLSLLAGLGLDRLLKMERPQLGPRAALFALAFVVVMVVSAVITISAFPAHGDQRQLQSALMQRDGVLLFATGGLVSLLYFMPRMKWVVLPVLLVTLAFDIDLHSRSRIPWTSASEAWPSSPVLEFLSRNAGPETGRIVAIERGFGSDSDREDERRRNLPAETNIHYGLASMESYSALQLREEAQFTAAAKIPVTANGKLSLAWSSPALFDDRLLDLAGVRWLLVPGDWQAQAELPDGTEIRSEDGSIHIHRYAGRDGLVLERPTAFPRAFLVWEARPGGLEEVLATDADLSHVAFVTGEIPRLVPGEGRVEIVELRADRMELDVEIERGRALLLTSDIDSRIWRVEVDGREREMVRADGLFRALVLESGRQRVVFRATSRHPAMIWGLALSGFSLLAALGLLILVRVRRRRSTS